MAKNNHEIKNFKYEGKYVKIEVSYAIFDNKTCVLTYTHITKPKYLALSFSILDEFGKIIKLICEKESLSVDELTFYVLITNRSYLHVDPGQYELNQIMVNDKEEVIHTAECPKYVIETFYPFIIEHAQ